MENFTPLTWEEVQAALASQEDVSKEDATVLAEKINAKAAAEKINPQGILFAMIREALEGEEQE